MNHIYCISWVMDDAFGLNAVVIAKDAREALQELDLDSEYETCIRVSGIGVCRESSQKKGVVCKESV